MKKNWILLAAVVLLLVIPACSLAQFAPGGKTAAEGKLVCSNGLKAAQADLESAERAMSDDDFETAEKLYTSALKTDPAYCEAMLGLGDALRYQERPAEALVWYQKLESVDPNDPAIVENLAYTYSMLEKDAEAEKYFNLLIQVEPDNPEGYYGLGIIYYEKEDPQKALTYFSKAEKIYTETGSDYLVDAQYYLGFTYYDLEDYDKAISYLELAYDTFSDEAQINYVLGVCHLNTVPPDLQQAKKYITKAQDAGMDIPQDVQDALKDVK
ncbi:MAG TPA: tetratricopeptide repeat protein [Anaerolineaceae bacterium]|nr:tetratricopeptide repeat protein [Anaerolineaceae bacterium]HPN51815.1 tetratricopeptide repeat protein [Anaerolineaceae bacterium]